MMEKTWQEPEVTALTGPMEIGSPGFDAYQAILLQKSKERSEQQRQKIELLSLKYQMEDYIQAENPEIVLAGSFLKRILKVLQIKQNAFAEYIGLKPSNLSKVLKGERPINYELALIFGKLFKHSPMLWIEIQAKNELSRLVMSDGEKYAEYSLSELVAKGKGTE